MAKERPIVAWPGVVLVALGLAQWMLSLFSIGHGWTDWGLVAVLAGAYWIGFAGWRILGHGFFFALAVLVLGLKFATVEIVYLEPPSVGVALIWPPTLTSRYLAPTLETGEFFFIVRPSDGGYPGRALYWSFALWGWWAVMLVWLAARLSWWPFGRWLRLDVPHPRGRRAPRSRRGRRKRLVSYGLGYFFIFLGVLGLFLPILQGILFLVIGFLFLGRVSPQVRLARLRLRRRFPSWAKRYDAVERTARDWIKRHVGRRKKRGSAASADRPTP